MYNGTIPVGGVAAGGGFAAMSAASGSPLTLTLAVTTLIIAVTALCTILPRVHRRKK